MKAGKEEKELGYCTVFSAERQPSVSMGGNERKEEMKNGSKIASVKSVVFDMMELFLWKLLYRWMPLCIHSQGHKYVFPRPAIIEILMSLLQTDNATGVSRSKEKHSTPASLQVK